VLPGGQRQYAGGYSSHQGMSGYGGNRKHADMCTSGNSWPYSGLECRELKGDASRRI
jgi:hypothetical protein